MRCTLLLFILIFSLSAEEMITAHTANGLAYNVTIHSGEVSYIAYTVEGPNRPITFAFNGGPGSSSVWLHMGTFGPRRVRAPEEGQGIAPPYELIDNPETILDLTDLVFIDPNGTGLSAMAEPEEGKKEKDLHSIRGDIRSVGDFIRDYLTANKRWNSPKYVAGESYGAVRAAGLAEYLLDQYCIYLNGLILVSAAIDYQTIVFQDDNPLPYFLFLPTYAATAWYHDRYRPESTIEEVAQEARDFIYETYAPSLLCRHCADPDSTYRRVSEMSGLPLDFIKKRHGYISDDDFFVEFFASQNQLVGRFDSREVGHLAGKILHDPSDKIAGIFSGALHQYLHDELNCPQSYNLFSTKVHQKWNLWNYNPWGYPNLMHGLRKALISNPSMKVFVGCGYYDLATPFATVEYCFDHLQVPNISVQMEYYEGGHMYYLNPSARTKFKQDLIRFYTTH